MWDAQVCDQDGLDGHRPTHTEGRPVLAGSEAQPDVAGSGLSASRVFDSPQLASCRQGVASPDRRGTKRPASPSPLALSPENGEAFAGSVSSQDVERELEKHGLTDEQDFIKAWQLRDGLHPRPPAVVEEPDASVQSPPKEGRLLKRVPSNEKDPVGVGKIPQRARQLSPGEIHPRSQPSGSDDVGASLSEVGDISDTVPLSQAPWFGDALTVVHNDFCKCFACVRRGNV